MLGLNFLWFDTYSCFLSRTTHVANFRSGSPLITGSLLSPPKSTSVVSGPTGLSVLMNGEMNQQDNRSTYQSENDHHMSALAAAGNVAESVALSKSLPSLSIVPPPPPPQGLHPPPQLPQSPGHHQHVVSTELDSINWNQIDLGEIDDLDMDFATLFDPATEIAQHQRMKDSQKK